jgi:hypothetical protein
MVDCGASVVERSTSVVKGMCFASGVIFGILLACAGCSQGPAYGSGPYGPPAEGGYYGGPPPGHPEISQAMTELQHARYILQAKAASDYHGHKANAIGYIDSAIYELQVCMSMP